MYLAAASKTFQSLSIYVIYEMQNQCKRKPQKEKQKPILCRLVKLWFTTDLYEWVDDHWKRLLIKKRKKNTPQ